MPKRRKAKRNIKISENLHASASELKKALFQSGLFRPKTIPNKKKEAKNKGYDKWRI